MARYDSLFTECSTVQDPMARYSIQVGWQEISQDEAERMRRGKDGLLLYEVFLKQVQNLNPGVVGLREAEQLAERLVRLHPSIRGNLEAWEYLRGNKTVYVGEERRELNVRLVDFDCWENNAFHFTRELCYTGGRKPIKLDFAYFINGIPILLVETKSARKQDAMVEALKQVRRYHEDGSPLLALMQIFAITDSVHFYYGPTWNTEQKALINWRTSLSLGQGADFETLVKEFVHPVRIVRILRDFILFVQRDGELTKVVLRPHQMKAVDKVLQRAECAVQPSRGTQPKRRGLIWHTQGSGKTFTMITIAQKLLNEPVFQNPTVLMLVDRNELEQQLFSNLTAVGLRHARLVESKQELQDLLQGDYRGLIVSTIQKFQGMPEEINTRSNIFVLIDEAHRTTGGNLGTYLMAALPNATIIGFTGTPIDKSARGRSTFQIFGKDDPPFGYLDKYSIREAIEDGTTVPLHYTLAENELLVDSETLEREFLSLAEAEGISDPEELDRILERAVNLRNMLKSPQRIEKVARFVVEHYREYVEPLGYKALMVAVDREACALYKEAFKRLYEEDPNRYLPPEAFEVVISKNPNDPELLRQYHRSEEEEREIRERFRREEYPKFLIVTSKLLTGFDAPNLFVMYLDKPMRDHLLLQAIARVNRPYERDGQRKTCGLIVDFVGIFEHLEKALAFDSQDIENLITDVDVLRERFEALMERARREFLPLAEGGDDKAVERVLEHFRDEERRQEFYAFYKELADIYEVLSPDAFLRPYLEEYAALTNMVRLLREAYDRGSLAEREVLRKTEQLVREHTRAGIIRGAVEVYEINADLLKYLETSRKPPTVEVFNLMKSIRQKVAKEGGAKPFLVSIGERAEAVVQAFQAQQKTAQQALEELKGIISEINAAEQELARQGLGAETFTIYWILHRNHGITHSTARSVAEKLVDIFEKYPYWASTQRQQRELRVNLYKVLREHEVQGNLSQIVHELMGVLLGHHA